MNARTGISLRSSSDIYIDGNYIGVTLGDNDCTARKLTMRVSNLQRLSTLCLYGSFVLQLLVRSKSIPELVSVLLERCQSGSVLCQYRPPLLGIESVTRQALRSIWEEQVSLDETVLSCDATLTSQIL